MNGHYTPLAAQIPGSEGIPVSVPAATVSKRLLDFSLIDALSDGHWPEVARHRLGSLFCSPPWIRAVAKTYDFAIKASVRTLGGKIEAAIPYCEISDLRGDRIVSLPFSDYCDPLVADRESWNRACRSAPYPQCPGQSALPQERRAGRR